MQEVEREGRGLGRGERVDDDPPGVAGDEGDVRQVDAAHLVDAVGHLEQSVDRVELRLAPEARVHRGGGIAAEERPVGGVPDVVAERRVHDRPGEGRDPAPGRGGEVVGVVGDECGHRGVGRGGRGARRFAFGVGHAAPWTDRPTLRGRDPTPPTTRAATPRPRGTAAWRRGSAWAASRQASVYFTRWASRWAHAAVTSAVRDVRDRGVGRVEHPAGGVGPPGGDGVGERPARRGQVDRARERLGGQRGEEPDHERAGDVDRELRIDPVRRDAERGLGHREAVAPAVGRVVGIGQRASPAPRPAGAPVRRPPAPRPPPAPRAGRGRCRSRRPGA